MSNIYGYCRISRATQNIERQERNILAAYPTAHILKEAFTGTKIQGRKELDKLIKTVQAGDTVVFDSASRMSRNADEAMELYEFWYQKGVNLIFLKEPYINTDTYKQALTQGVPMTGTDVDCILKGVNEYFMVLAKKQVRMVFDQAQKEVDDLHQRTSEGMLTAKLNGKRVGASKGDTYTTKKSITAKQQIRKYNKAFGGSLNDLETIKQISISRNTFYKYKNELLQEEIQKAAKDTEAVLQKMTEDLQKTIR